MTPKIDLHTLNHAEKNELILSLVGQLEAALARIAELEKRLAVFERPAKTPDNSSVPPSKGQKPNRPAGDRPPRKGRPGFGRTLHPNPDRVFDAKLTACPKCQAAFPRPRSRSTNASNYLRSARTLLTGESDPADATRDYPPDSTDDSNSLKQIAF